MRPRNTNSLADKEMADAMKARKEEEARIAAESFREADADKKRKVGAWTRAASRAVPCFSLFTSSATRFAGGGSEEEGRAAARGCRDDEA